MTAARPERTGFPPSPYARDKTNRDKTNRADVGAAGAATPASAATGTPGPAESGASPAASGATTPSAMTTAPAGPSNTAAATTEPAAAPARTWSTSEPAPMLRRRSVRPRQGWQSLAYTATGGRWNPGPGAREARELDRDRQIATQLRGKHVTAFFCLKGGVSKTSTTAATSLALSNLRPDPVFAIDANPDAGDLAERVVGRQLSGVSALAREVDSIASLDDLSRFTVTSGRLTMLPGEPSPTLGDSLTAADFRRIMEVIRQYYSFVQVDCGTGVTHPLMEGILEYADTVVVPAAWSITGARRAAETIQWLEDNGFEHLARTSIVVLTAKDLVSRSVDKDAVLEHLGRASDLVVVPADPHVADGAVIEWDLLSPETREAYLEIAAAITSRFRTP
ncbi:MinD/ParA family ATP-binding protein [Agilicoccus flavus]|uniref:MinD/ParA family ATP-binding protein n=1 Tax=Agilicoccus flavus TaxID=2775968 RepID=UPI001CF6EF3B|nr:MinD/ParA family protein [Agilicoccus flavus]